MISQREKIARLISGPHNPPPPHVKTTLAELQDIVWTKHLTDYERSKFLRAADVILERVIQPLVAALEQIKEGVEITVDEDTKEDFQIWMDSEDLQQVAYKALQEYNKS